VREAAKALLGWDDAQLGEVLNPEHMLRPCQPNREYVCFTSDRPEAQANRGGKEE
jgi:hypothetical protein